MSKRQNSSWTIKKVSALTVAESIFRRLRVVPEFWRSSCVFSGGYSSDFSWIAAIKGLLVTFSLSPNKFSNSVQPLLLQEWGTGTVFGHPGRPPLCCHDRRFLKGCFLATDNPKRTKPWRGKEPITSPIIARNRSYLPDSPWKVPSSIAWIVRIALC